MKLKSVLPSIISLLALTACASLTPTTFPPEGANLQPPLGTPPPAVALRAWGALGVWKVDCSIQGNGGSSYIDEGNGEVVQQEEVAAQPEFNLPARIIQFKILDARVRSDGSLEITQYNPVIHSSTQRVDVKDTSGRSRTIFNENLSTGFYTVFNGKFVFPGPNGESFEGGPTHWSSRCSAPE